MPRGFDANAVAWLDETKYVKIRAGAAHRFINIWIVVVKGRAFARSWNNKPSGWFAAFHADAEGAIEIDGNAVAVVARPVKDAKMLNAVTTAFGRKYTTKANVKFVVGFAEKGRRENTIEVVPSSK